MFSVATANNRLTRMRIRPLWSNALTELANVGGSLADAIASTSARSSASAIVNASEKSSGRISSHGGTPPYGPVHGPTNGLVSTLELELESFAIRPHAATVMTTTAIAAGTEYFPTNIRRRL